MAPRRVVLPPPSRQFTPGQEPGPAAGAAIALREEQAPQRIGARQLRRQPQRRWYVIKPWIVLVAASLALLLHGIPVVAAGAIWMILPATLVGAVKFFQQKCRRHRIYTCIYTALTATWMAYAALYGLNGPGRFLPVLLVVPGIFPLSWLWWSFHQVAPEPDPEPEPEVVEAEIVEEEPPVDMILVMWNKFISGEGGRGADMYLSFLDEIGSGVRYRIHLKPGRHTPEDAMRILLNIASAFGPLGISRQQIVVEPFPGDPVTGETYDHLALLTILQKRPPTREIQEFTQPTLIYDKGLFADGPYQDGDMAYARLYKVDENGRPHRGASGLWVGQQGSGKSRLLEHKILEHLLSGIGVVIFLDGGRGNSMPGLIDHVYWPAITPDEWIRALKAVVRLGMYRTVQMTAERVGCWYASPSRPFVHLVIDEAQEVLKVPACVRGVKYVIQVLEKAGFSVDLATHQPLTSELGDSSGVAGASIIRDLIKNGNVGVFKTGSSWTKQVTIGDWIVDPQYLPADMPGAHYLGGATTRQAPIRAIRVADPAAWANAAPMTCLSPEEEAAMDGETGDFLERWERFRAQSSGEISTDDINQHLAEVFGIEDGDEDGASGTGTQAPAAGAPSCMRLVLDIVRKQGRIKRAEIDRLIGDKFSESSVTKALRAMRDSEAITNAYGEPGEWMSAEHVAQLMASGEIPAEIPAELV
jgi:hypothetical protein